MVHRSTPRYSLRCTKPWWLTDVLSDKSSFLDNTGFILADFARCVECGRSRPKSASEQILTFPERTFTCPYRGKETTVSQRQELEPNMLCGDQSCPVPFRDSEDRRSRWGWFKVNLQHSQALQRAHQIKLEVRLQPFCFFLRNRGFGHHGLQPPGNSW